MTHSGRLFYVVGASGAGKDSIINAAIVHAKKQDKLLIAPRTVTRLKQQSGSDIPITKPVFRDLVTAGAFLFSWQAHGYHYGIENKILAQLRVGNNILVNGSRAYIANARRIYPAVIIVGVQADQQHLRERLKKRSREDKADIAERMERNLLYEEALQRVDVVINNEQPLEQAVVEFLALIRDSEPAH